MNDYSQRAAVRAIIESAAYDLIRTYQAFEPSCRSLWPLGLALLEGAALFAVLESTANDHHAIADLFDGGESNGPNLDTRLMCIRNLCGASIYGLRQRASEGSACDQSGCTEAVEAPGEAFWAKLISQYVASNDGPTITEVARLLDDVFEETARIAKYVKARLPYVPPKSWNEIYRAVCHIRDHIDYGESMILSCIKAASENPGDAAERPGEPGHSG
jgi:hypothetical protein